MDIYPSLTSFTHRRLAYQLEQLPEKEGNGLMDAAIDSSGRDVVEKMSKLLKPGGKVVVYGV